MLIWLIHLADKQQSLVTRAGTSLRHHNNRQRQLVYHKELINIHDVKKQW